MAQYKAMEGFDKMDQKELTGYLYQLNEQLRYMFDNLTPEDNYSNQALTKYLEDEKRVASLKFDLDGLKVEVSDFEKNTNAKFKVTDSKIEMKVTKGTVSSEISLESGQVTISGNRLVVNSTNFKLDASGNATFSGTVKGATITGSHIRCKGGAFEADEDAVYIGGFYTFDTSRGQYLGTGDQSAGMGDNDLYCFWTGWGRNRKHQRYKAAEDPGSLWMCLVSVQCLCTGIISQSPCFFREDPLLGRSGNDPGYL